MAKKTDDLLSFNEIQEAIDKEAVAKAILAFDEGEKPFDEFDFQDCKEVVWTAGEKWLARDLQEFTLESVEKKVVTDLAGPEYPFKCFLDVCGEIRGTMKPFNTSTAMYPNGFKGLKYIIDWKTSKNTLGTEWKARLLDSHQWPLYSEVYGASLFVYRGVSRKDMSTQEVLIPVPPTNSQEVLHQLKSLGCQLNALRNEHFQVYPRNKPFACNAYGRECQFYESCIQFKMPWGEIPLDKPLSYSFMQDFMLCQERARRKVLAEGFDYYEETTFGKRAHAGLAELWSQAYAIFGKNADK